jgi:methyltransferase (TIGR00027 family)
MDGVSRTAIGVARLRAKENERPDRLFHDPYAQAFVAAYESAQESTPSPIDSVFQHHVAIRTRFFDDYLLASGCEQIVLLAAGLDTRAFRLDWPPNVRLFELDLPELLEYKEKVLAAQDAEPRSARTVLRVDLREDWASQLIGAGFRPTEPTAWLVEGLLVYLAADEAAALLTEVGRLSAPGSQLSCEYRTAERVVGNDSLAPAMQRLTAMWKGGLGTETNTWLAEHGWQVRLHDGQTLAEEYGRSEPGARVSNFLVAVR